MVEEHEFANISPAAAGQIRLLQRLLKESRLEVARLLAAKDK